MVNSVVNTAYSVARSRAFSDIPFSSETAQWLEKEVNLYDKSLSGRNKGNAVTLEARYKLINNLLDQHKVDQILELACGVLPRGFTYSKRGVIYVETDLKEIIDLKKKLYKDVFPTLPKTLFLEEANALDKKELNATCRHFDKNKEVAVVNEGLLRYFSFEDKAIIAQNVYSILKQFGGVWITCDITLAKSLSKEDLERTKRNSGLDVSNNVFRDVEHAKSFFEKIGFKVKVHHFEEVLNELTSPKKLGLDEKEIKRQLSWRVFEMKI